MRLTARTSANRPVDRVRAEKPPEPISALLTLLGMWVSRSFFSLAGFMTATHFAAVIFYSVGFTRRRT